MSLASILIVASFISAAAAGILVDRDSCAILAPACQNPGPAHTYQREPCFPTTGVCYPTNYYAAQDQGQFSSANGAFETQLNAKCRATCDQQSQCLSYVGIINKAADSNLATGTCFYYNVQQLSPRRCADAPSGIFAYYKQKVCPVTTTSSTTTTSSSSTTKSTTTSTTSSSTTSSSTTSSSTTSSSATLSSTTSSSATSSSTTSSSTTSSSTTTSSTTSSSTTSSTTSSIAPAAATCSGTFKVQIQGGDHNGAYLYLTSNYRLGPTSASSAPYFQLVGLSINLAGVTPPSSWISYFQDYSGIYVGNAAFQTMYTLFPLDCTVQNTAAAASGTGSGNVGTIICHSEHDDSTFFTCTTDGDRVAISTDGLDSSCTQVQLVGVCV